MSMYAPSRLGALYLYKRGKYYSRYNKANNFNSNNFIELSRFLDKEKVIPEEYFDFAFGMLDNSRPLTPKGLCNPLVVRKFREMVK